MIPGTRVRIGKPCSTASIFLPARIVDPVRRRKGTDVARGAAKLDRTPRLCARPVVSMALGSLNRLTPLQTAIASVRHELSRSGGEIAAVDGDQWRLD